MFPFLLFFLTIWLASALLANSGRAYVLRDIYCVRVSQLAYLHGRSRRIQGMGESTISTEPELQPNFSL